MLTNTSVTLYNKYTLPTGKEMYKRTVIQKANWQGDQDKAVSNNVLQSADSINISIPMIDNDFEGKAYIEPKKWSKLTDVERDNYFTFQATDRIVKGECDFIPTATLLITELSKYDNAISIMSIKVNDYGSNSLQHFKIGGK